MNDKRNSFDAAHLADEELLQLLDGELPGERIEGAHAHLGACEECEGRFVKIRVTSAELLGARRGALEVQGPVGGRQRELLRSRLQTMGQGASPGTSTRAATSLRKIPIWPYAAAAVLAAALSVGALRMRNVQPRPIDTAAMSKTEPIPDRKLTPGATITATRAQVCRMPEEAQVQVVPVAVKRKVFQEYGMANARPEDYEMDYLITPGLGGSSDIRNLWPEPYSSTVWNAKVKDELEDRLRQMVCAGALELSTAQRDIATDWISAYKKYFHTDHPLSQAPRVVTEHPRS